MFRADYLIVGSGLAGSILAWELLAEGKQIAIVSDSKLPTSSRVAGGLINPVTGKYLAKTWLAEKLFPKLEKFYKSLEDTLGESFYYKTGLYRPFSGDEHKRSSLAQINKHHLQDYIEIGGTFKDSNEYFNADLGGLFSKDAGWLDIPKMLDLLHGFFKKNTEWIDESFEFEALQIGDSEVVYKNIEADKVIFCEGFYVKDNPYFNWLPFNPVKGETLVGEIDNYQLPYIVNQGKWLIPLGENKVRLGATYSWHELDFMPTEKGKEELLNVGNKILKKDFKPLYQLAGVRPATKDRRPIIGKHPQYSPLYIFNGLGTKGVSLAPFFAEQLVNHLLKNEVLYPEVNIKRFYALYS